MYKTHPERCAASRADPRSYDGGDRPAALPLHPRCVPHTAQKGREPVEISRPGGCPPMSWTPDCAPERAENGSTEPTCAPKQVRAARPTPLPPRRSSEALALGGSVSYRTLRVRRGAASRPRRAAHEPKEVGSAACRHLFGGRLPCRKPRRGGGAGKAPRIAGQKRRVSACLRALSLPKGAGGNPTIFSTV